MGENSIESLSVPELALDTVEIKQFGSQRQMVAKRKISPGEILLKSEPISLVLRNNYLG